MNVVFDDRYPENVLYKSDDVFKCMAWINDNYPEEHEAFQHIWIEKR